MLSSMSFRSGLGKGWRQIQLRTTDSRPLSLSSLHDLRLGKEYNDQSVVTVEVYTKISIFVPSAREIANVFALAELNLLHLYRILNYWIL